MLSNEHEGLAELFRHQPVLAAALAAELGADVPAFADAGLEPSAYSDVMPTEWRPDGVVALTGAAGEREMAIVVEVQRGWNKAKPWVWPVYVAATRARLECPVVLLVVCPDPAVAHRCAEPIDTGHPDFVLRPLVLDPARVPVVTDPQRARQLPELAVLSAAAHGERLVSEFTAKGLADGKAEAVLEILAARGIDVPDDARVRIKDCTDIDQLDTWVRGAVTATAVGELFD
jgi:hypothetical protein